VPFLFDENPEAFQIGGTEGFWPEFGLVFLSGRGLFLQGGFVRNAAFSFMISTVDFTCALEPFLFIPYTSFL
jgi:hypothetical protein